MDGFTEGNLLIGAYFPSVDISKISLDEYFEYLASVKFIQEQKTDLIANAIAKVFSEE